MLTDFKDQVVTTNTATLGADAFQARGADCRLDLTLDRLEAGEDPAHGRSVAGVAASAPRRSILGAGANACPRCAAVVDVAQWNAS
jgi:hypothetical protein